MLEYTEQIREISERLLKECQVEMVIGFRKGTMPMMNEPCFIKDAKDVEQLVWDSNCGINLANYLTNRQEKIGIIAKGCDSRNIVTHIIENKISREQVVVIGVPCQGMIDKRKITAMFDGEIEDVSENGSKVTVVVDGKANELDKADVIQKNCAVCTHRNPVIHDEMVAEPVEERQDVDRYEDVRKIEAMDPQEKWEYFEELLAPCVRCYACKNACPLCYCPTCFVDEAKPQLTQAKARSSQNAALWRSIRSWFLRLPLETWETILASASFFRVSTAPSSSEDAFHPAVSRKAWPFSVITLARYRPPSSIRSRSKPSSLYGPQFTDVQKQVLLG